MCFDNNSWNQNFGVQMQDVPAGRAFGGYDDGVTGSCNHTGWWSTIDTDKRPLFGFAGQIQSVGSTCESALVAVPVTVNTASTPPTITPVSGSICPNTNVALTAGGGTAGTGSNIHWYTGPNGTGTYVGAGSPITVAPTSTTTYYARREGTCNTTTDDAMTVNVKSYVYAANGTSSNTYCTDNDGWNHFFVGDDIIFSVQGNLSAAPAGFPLVTIYDNGTYYQETEGPGTAAGCVLNQTPGEERFEMQRSWNVDMGGGAPIGAYQIRFYYPPAERTAIENAANAWMATYPDCGYYYKYPTPNGFYWFKNSGTNYFAPQYEDTQYAAIIGSTPNGVNYSQWSGIPGFSGGSGAIILSPLDVLPVELTLFSAICNSLGNEVNVRWTTASESNSSHFDVERSVDGISWETIASVDAAGSSNDNIQYEVVDNDVRGYNTIYYRLQQYDFDGKSMEYGPVSTHCDGSEQGWEVFPNPTTGNVNVALYGLYADENAVIQVSDVNGKLLFKLAHTPDQGSLVPVDLSTYTPGVYLIQLQNALGNIETVKVVKY